MQLLKDFIQHTNYQLIWTSEQAKLNWENILDDLKQKVNDLEILSVVENQRPCAWQTIHEDLYIEFVRNINEKGLIIEPIRYSGIYQGFSHYTPEPKEGEKKLLYCIISKSLDDINKFRNYYKKGDNKGQGELLGFPDCCYDFFEKVWKDGYFDPMWQIFQNSDSKKIDPLSNPFLRYLGIRLSFHIPCKLNCRKTIEISKERLSLLDDESQKLLIALLSMPLSWSVLHGAAILKTPLFYLIYNSVATAKKYEIMINGKFIPEEMPDGIKFPFNLRRKKQ